MRNTIIGSTFSVERFRFAFLLVSGLALGASACGTEPISPGSQQVGQACYGNVDCASGLTCTPDRICVPAAQQPTGNNATNSSPNNSPNNSSPNNTAVNNTSVNNANTGTNDEPNNIVVNNISPNNNFGPNDEPNNNFGPNVDPNNFNPNDEPSCEPGFRYCESDRNYIECVFTDEGEAVEVRRRCPDFSFCDGGECIEECVDRDGDGTFGNCEPFDCDDRDPNRSPFNPEFCGDGIDNDCNMAVDENCEMECCPGGCGGNTFCSDCQCVPYDPFFCQQDNQPCENIDTFTGGYYCADFTASGEGRCIGLCDLNSPDPAQTCPEMGQSCTFGEEGGQFGLCFDNCNAGDSCGSPSQGCFVYNDPSLPADGVCTPADPNKNIGDPCDEATDGFFGCAAGSVCVNLNPQFGSGTCVQSCRPFFNGPTDCAAGTNCIAFSEAIGVCTANNMLTEGDRCSQIYNSCGEDNVTCYPTRTGGLRCQRTCRLSRGDADCGPNAPLCRNLSMDNNEIGVCTTR